MYEIDPIQPTASDFGHFVFCGLQWFFDKDKRLEGVVAAKKASYYKSSEAVAREVGIKNEHRCVDWVLEHHTLSTRDILYKGTYNSDPELLNFEISGTRYSCKPDIVVNSLNGIILYEFKSVGNPKQLGSQFESNRAQIWCYTKILNLSIDKYFLFQYYLHPFYTKLDWNQKSYVTTEQFPKERNDHEHFYMEFIPKEQHDPSYFLNRFSQYQRTISSVNEKSKNLIKLLLDNSPKSSNDNKCYRCIYKPHCPIGSM